MIAAWEGRELYVGGDADFGASTAWEILTRGRGAEKESADILLFHVFCFSGCRELTSRAKDMQDSSLSLSQSLNLSWWRRCNYVTRVT